MGMQNWQLVTSTPNFSYEHFKRHHVHFTQNPICLACTWCSTSRGTGCNKNLELHWNLKKVLAWILATVLPHITCHNFVGNDSGMLATVICTFQPGLSSFQCFFVGAFARQPRSRSILRKVKLSQYACSSWTYHDVTAGFLFLKAINSANAESDRQNKADGYWRDHSRTLWSCLQHQNCVFSAKMSLDIV